MSGTERGSPHFMGGLRRRRQKLLELLKGSSKENWPKVKARFAMDENLTREKVDSYFLTLKEAGLLDEVPTE